MYIDNIDALADYNLNRKFEYVIFLQPSSLSSGIEFTLLQTGTELSPNVYDIDGQKLKLSIIDNKLNLTHSIKRTNLIYDNEHYSIFTEYAWNLQTPNVNQISATLNASNGDAFYSTEIVSAIHNRIANQGF